MKCQGSDAARFIPSMDVLASLLALFVLLPIAGALPGIASQGQPLMDGIWFTFNLGGAVLLLAAGIKLLVRTSRRQPFVALYIGSVGALGTLALQLRNFHFLIGGWLAMSLCVAGLLLMLRNPLVWAMVGATWCVLLLGIWSVGGVANFLTTDRQRLSLLLPLQIIAFLITLVLLIFHVRYRGSLVEDQKNQV